MKKIISLRNAGSLLLVLLIFLFFFHILVIAGVLPSDIVWGGGTQRMTRERVITFEFISLIILLLFMLITLLKTGRIKSDNLKLTANLATWIMFVYFLLNAISNFFSEASTEQIVFGPLSVILAFLTLRLAIEK
jgi:hypothetical protein